MKRIEFIAPVEAMRGNLSGKQGLEYPLNGSGAYYAPNGKHYAQNYQPRFIGAKRASDNLKYFAVRTKNAVNLTAASRKAMAVLGATGAIMGAILADKTSALYTALMNAFEATKPSKDGKPLTFRQYVTSYIMASLRAKFPLINVIWNNAGAIAMITINNPFVSGGTGTYDVTLSDDVLVKFWSELANNPITFSVAGQKGIAHQGDDFGVLVAGHYNTLRLTKVTIEAQGEMIKFGDEYVTREVGDAPVTVQDIDIIDGSENYFLDSEYHVAG